jgi:Fur family ferric uptake transcriptional regulator
MAMSPRTVKEPVPVPPEVQSRLERAGLRRTLATRAVVGLFLVRPGTSLTHAQALAALTARGLDINRVTLYRLLDRLAGCGVLLRQADEQRTWRFSLAPLADAPASFAVPRFACDVCLRRFPLPPESGLSPGAVQSVLQALAPLGHVVMRVNMSIHGTCASCAASGPEGAGPA